MCGGFSLFGALPARQSAKQHRGGRGMERVARGASRAAGVRRSRTDRYKPSAPRPRLSRRRVGGPNPSPVTLFLCMSTRRPQGRAQNGQPWYCKFSLVATLAYVVVTFVAGLRAHSLALLSESGHNTSDFLALLLSFAAVYFQSRPADDTPYLRLPAGRSAGRLHQRRHADSDLAVDWRRGHSPALKPGGRAAAG